MLRLLLGDEYGHVTDIVVVAGQGDGEHVIVRQLHLRLVVLLRFRRGGRQRRRGRGILLRCRSGGGGDFFFVVFVVVGNLRSGSLLALNGFASDNLF